MTSLHQFDASIVKRFTPDSLKNYDHIIFDIDGVLMLSQQFINPNVEKTLLNLAEQHKDVFLCTNNSTQHRDLYISRFTDAQIPFSINNLYTSASTAANYVQYEILNHPLPVTDSSHVFDINTDRKILVIGEEGFLQEFKDRNLMSNVVTLDTFRPNFNSLEDLSQYPIDPNITCIVVGLQADFSWVDACIVTMILRENKNVDFIATSRVKTYPATKTRQLPDVGSIVEMIQSSNEVCAKIMDKPERFMIDAIVRDHNIDLTRTLMVGDRLDSDIAFGNKWGMDTLLVFSGVVQKDQFATLHQLDGFNFDINEWSSSGLHVQTDHTCNSNDTSKLDIPTFWANDVSWLVQENGL